MGAGHRGGNDQGATHPPTGRRLTVPEAAEALGITADAVRSRIKRKTLQAKREGGRVFVVLAGPDRARPTNAQAATDQPTRGEADDDLREQVRYLREQLRREQDAHAEARRIIAGLVQRVPAIDPPTGSAPDAPGPPETASEGSGGAAVPRSDTPGPQTGAQRPWWRRIIGI